MIPRKSPPLRYFVEECTDPAEVRARLTVLREKAFRVQSYNATLYKDALDWKQRMILYKYRLEPGIDPMPQFVCRSLRRTIDRLEARKRELETKAAA